jgi:hypothetical protein
MGHADDLLGRIGAASMNAHHKVPDLGRRIEDVDRVICDTRFIAQLEEVFRLKRFLFEENVRFNTKELDSIDLGLLNCLKFGLQGRLPTDDEWKLLDHKLAYLSSYLDDGLRRKLGIRQVSLFFGPLPLAFLLVTVLSTLGYLILPNGYNLMRYLTMIIWTIAQGGLVLLRHKFLRKFRGKLRAHAGHRGSRAWPIA